MNVVKRLKKTCIIVGLLPVILTLLVSLVSADISVFISLKDVAGREISGEHVLIGTTAVASGHYEDPTHGLEAAATLSVWFKGPDDPGFIQEAILFSGWINSNTTITREYQLTKIGTYKFKWEVETIYDEATVSTTTFVIPESPVGTLLGIIAPMSAVVGFFAFKRFRKGNLPRL